MQCVWGMVCNLRNVQSYTIVIVIQGEWDTIDLNAGAGGGRERGIEST